MTSHVIAYRSLELLFGTHTFNFNCFFDDSNCVFTQIRCLSRVLLDKASCFMLVLAVVLILLTELKPLSHSAVVGEIVSIMRISVE